MAEFAGITVGPNLFSTLTRAHKRFKRIELVGDRTGKAFSDSDDWAFAHLPEIAAHHTVAATEPDAIQAAVAELWQLDVRLKEPAAIIASTAQEGMTSLLEAWLESLLLADPECERIARERSRRINGKSLANYGTSAHEAKRIGRIKTGRIRGDRPCQGRYFGTIVNCDCSSLAEYHVLVPGEKGHDLCRRCYYGPFRPRDEWPRAA
jgi:hypothetical protein